MVEISAAAAQEIKRIQRSRQKLDSYLRLSIKSGGCSGSYYSLELNETIGSSDRHHESHGFLILIDENHYSCLQELKIDYSEDLMGGGFRFHNSNVTATCSCGFSFSPRLIFQKIS